MLKQIAYQCDDNGFFVEEVFCQESPLEPGVWLCPARATFQPPPKAKEGKLTIHDFNQKKWVYIDKPEEEVIENAFALLSPSEKKNAIISAANQSLGICQTALERMQWRELLGQPVEQSLKVQWSEYRKAISACIDPKEDDAYFVQLESVEAYVWPKQPAMPEEPA